MKGREGKGREAEESAPLDLNPGDATARDQPNYTDLTVGRLKKNKVKIGLIRLVF